MPFPISVEAAPVETVTRVGLVFDLSIIGHGFPQSLGLPRFHTGATDAIHEEAAHRQCLVADLFCGESKSRTAGEEVIVRVTQVSRRSRVR